MQSCGTVQNIKADDLSTTKIYENLNKSQSDLYVISNSWMIDTFKNAESVIQFSDKETGSIIGKYLMQGSIVRSGYLSTDTRIFAKIDISLKDDRAKITIAPTDDITIWQSGASVKFRDQINDIIESYNVAINKNNALNW
jgi:hypothetical protein